MDEPRDLGLFPLDLVLLPGERIPLQLFEPRYRQLYADCVLDDRPFVVVRTTPSGPESVGCAAQFDELIQRLDDGRLHVVVLGTEPVEIIEETDGNLYFSATVREPCRRHHGRAGPSTRRRCHRPFSRPGREGHRRGPRP